jgi:AcrR family transcriptional regulator
MVEPSMHPPEAAQDAPLTPSQAGPEASARGVTKGLGFDVDERGRPVADPVEDEGAQSQDRALVDQTGRPLGARALQTRQRILDATVAELDSKPMRDLRVIDIARRVGSSPATFYQYFKDIEDAVLQLAEQATSRTPIVVDAIHGEWSGREGFERAKVFVSRGIQHWRDYGPILRVRNNASDEGDERFNEVRLQAIIPMINAFAEEIEASERRASESNDPQSPADEDLPLGRIDPRAGAMVTFAMLDRFWMYHDRMIARGISHEDLVETGATILQFIMTARK